MTGTAHLRRLGKVTDGFANGFSISASVGDWEKGAVNRSDDVETVQLLLEYVSQKHGRLELNPRGVDGQISRVPGKSSTVKAIVAFQRGFMTRPDGLIEPDGTTLQKLREEVKGDSSQAGRGAESVMRAPRPSDSLPPWLHAFNGLSLFSPLSLLAPPAPPQPDWISVAEQELGQEEIGGKKHNQRIVDYHAATGGAKDDETPWCASFVNWVLKQSGYDGAGSAWSHAWKNWGDGLSQPAVGSVAFIDWGKVDPKKQGKGHVGFVVGKTAKDRIVLLGGNQSDKVRYTAFKSSHIQTYRVPKGYQPPKKLYDLPVMTVTEDGGGFAATR